MPLSDKLKLLMAKHKSLEESIERRVDERLAQHPVLEKTIDKAFEQMDDRVHQIGTDFDEWGNMFREGSNSAKAGEGETGTKVPVNEMKTQEVESGQASTFQPEPKIGTG